MLLLKLVETGKKVDQDAFLISLPRGTRHRGDAGSRDWSGSIPVPAPETCSQTGSRVMLLKHILTMPHPCP